MFCCLSGTSNGKLTNFRGVGNDCSTSFFWPRKMYEPAWTFGQSPTHLQPKLVLLANQATQKCWSKSGRATPQPCKLRAVFVVPTDPAILRELIYSNMTAFSKKKKRIWDFRSSAYKTILWQWKTPHPSLSQNPPRNCLQIFGTFLWNSTGNLIWPNYRTNTF